ncbi:unnamed protein product [Sphenostylis stenocarpa]|uniref:Protein kinase domain-containing protein n=1 Tax=Sphenostylis stenocarpa TaxID=92480 RepID=A0AA86V9Q8_9FABA|nr:unnamed protein product [Sphenostylis stenocarpa]
MIQSLTRNFSFLASHLLIATNTKHVGLSLYTHTFCCRSNEMESEIDESIDMADYFTFDAFSFFTLAVDNEIRSGTSSNLGASPRVHSFASMVDIAIRSRTSSNWETSSRVCGFASGVGSAIKSRTPSNLGTPRVHSFSSGVDFVIRSSSGGTDLETSPVHGLASEVYTRNVAAGSSQVPLNATGLFVEGLQLFSLAELVDATDNFSHHNKIGVGSFGVVYGGKLVDGSEVAIKRNETSSKMKEFQKIVFGYLLTFLRRLHHEHLVGLVGFCEEKDDRLLVYEYMKNGSLYDHLHHKGSIVLNSWKTRIKIALDASRGIEYLHYYAGTNIYRAIKSSNILLDDTWTARVSDFGLSSLMEAAGTIGYIDSEFCSLYVLTAKSEVYAFGVVLLEILTGKTPILCGEDGSTPLSVVEFAVPPILAGDLAKILDPRVGAPRVNEAKAVELVAYTAIRCVNLEGKDRPSMAEIVLNLEKSLDIICDI